MTKIMHKAYAEVYEILKYMPKEYIEKIPMKFMRMFEDCSLTEYNILIEPNRSLQEQQITYEAKVVMAILKYNYWLDSDGKQKMMERLRENDLKNKEQYDLSDLNQKFKPRTLEENVKKDMQVSSENYLPAKVENKFWFGKIIDKIKNFFTK